MTSTGALTSNTAVHRRKTSPRSTPGFRRRAVLHDLVHENLRRRAAEPLLEDDAERAREFEAHRVGGVRERERDGGGGRTAEVDGEGATDDAGRLRRFVLARATDDGGAASSVAVSRRRARAREAREGSGARRGAADMARVAEWASAASETNARRGTVGANETGRVVDSSLFIDSILSIRSAWIGIRRRGRRI